LKVKNLCFSDTQSLYIFKKMKTLCDIEGEISNWTNWHNFGRKIMSIWYIFQIQLLSAIYKDKKKNSTFDHIFYACMKTLITRFFKIYSKNSVSLVYWNCFLMIYTKFGTKMCLFRFSCSVQYMKTKFSPNFY
jgi:hypothetical protein